MKSSMEIRFFRSGSVLVWINSLGYSAYDIDQCTNKMNELAHESFSLKFELNIRV